MMKTIKFLKINLMAIVAILFASTVMSFKLDNQPRERTDNVYFYVSSDKSEGAFHTVGNWSLTNDAVNCNTGGERPCSITVPSNIALSTYLGAQSNDDIMELSAGTKP